EILCFMHTSPLAGGLAQSPHRGKPESSPIILGGLVELDNAFDVDAPPHDVYAFLLDVNRVAGCVPGAELSEIVDPNTFNGRVKVRVGPITVAYAGTARIVDRDDETHRAELQAEGRETSGPGSARAHA